MDRSNFALQISFIENVSSLVYNTTCEVLVAYSYESNLGLPLSHSNELTVSCHLVLCSYFILTGLSMLSHSSQNKGSIELEFDAQSELFIHPLQGLE